MLDNIILIGFMGCGKTTFGTWIAKNKKMDFCDTDALIVEKEKKSINDIFSENGEPYFRELETEIVKDLIKSRHNTVVSVGGGLPLRSQNRELLKKLGLVVYLDVSPETVYKRIGADVSSRPMLHSDDVPGRIRSLLNERRPLYLKAAHVAVDVNDRSLDAITEEIYREAHK